MLSPIDLPPRGGVNELKFLISPNTADFAARWARRHLELDPHADPAVGDGYLVHSLYFDTPEWDTLHRRGSYARSKFRIRRYGAADAVFLERKLKTGSVVRKRRTLVPLGELPQLELDDSPGWTGEWYRRRLHLRRLHPVCQIRYRRSAFSLDALRLTIDHDLRAWRSPALAFENEREGAALTGDQCILELKFPGKLPSPFKSLMKDYLLVPRPVSKYRLADGARLFA